MTCRPAGAVFRTASDTEVILEGYRRWGSDVVERLNGMFAFVIWDRRRAGRVWRARSAWHQAAVLGDDRRVRSSSRRRWSRSVCSVGSTSSIRLPSAT